jgi:protein HIRA/HIR1
MLVQKPDWVAHSGPIYSIDVHPGGTRFATAGSDHKVKLWSLLPLLDARFDADAEGTRLLATLTDHHAPVNVVRFSRGGRQLASGSDDKLVCVYELREGTGSAAFGSTDAPSVENWKPSAALRGHHNNVTDLAWSPSGGLLASASLDNSVIVWDAASGHRVRTLAGHESYVKGVAWDPIGTFLASQSDDRSVRVWRCQDWSPLARTAEPFAEGFVSTTFSLRLDWAPDGQHLLAVNALQPPCHTAPLLERGTWKAPYSLVGHTAAVVAAHFNPRLLQPLGCDGQVALP